MFTACSSGRGLLRNDHVAAIYDKPHLSCLNDMATLSSINDMTDYPIKTPEQLGAVLRGYRRDQSLTQKSVGAKCGLAQNAISQIEAAPGKASLARIFKLLAALELEIVVRNRGKSGRRSDW